MGGNSTKNGGGRAGSADSAASGVDATAATAVGTGAPEASSSGSGAGGADVGRLESVGLVGSTDELIAQAELAAASVPNIDPTTGQAVTADPNINGQWAALTPPAVEVLCAVVLPAWEIQPAEQRPVSEALSECLDQVFPGGIEGKYACWVRLIFACGAITVSRVATHGKLPPLFLPKSAAKPAPAASNGAAGPARVDPMTLTSLTE